MQVGEESGRRGQLLAALGGGIVGAGVVAGVLIAILGTGGSTHGTTTPPASTGPSASSSAATGSAPPLSGAAAAMVALLTKGSSVSYHARYTVTSPQVTTQGARVQLELWRRLPDVRQDTLVTQKGTTIDTAAFQSGSGVVECTKTGTGGFACRQTSSTGLANPADIAANAAKELAGATVTQTSATIAGRSATCFEITLSGTTNEVCADADGIPLQVSSKGSSMVLESLDHTFASGIFTPPAAVS